MNAKRSRGPLGPAKQGMPGALPGKVERERGESVQVVVRCRPMSRKEEGQGHTQIIDMWPQRGIVHITKPRKAPGRASARMFTFDSVYDWNSNQDDLYENTVKPLVYSVLDGYNGTIFAYGQTGTGKTYTMLGSQQQQGQGAREKGISSKCFEDIFRHIAYTSDRTSYVVRASYFEIYQEETRDLLSPEPGQGHGQGDRRQFSLLWGEDAVRGVYVKGLQSVVCKNIKAIERVMRVGNVNRATAATNMNEHSSRSHAIFQITIEMRDAARRPGVKPGQGPLTAPVQGSGFRMGKLNLVDLAGSERQCKTGAVGDRLKESSKINLSLSALGNVISALVDGRAGQGHRHIPYRDSKLTQLLQDSLGGNSKAIMIANIGPASYNYDESLMTLRYASRAKHIKNMPTRNVNALASLGARVARGPRSALSHYNEEMRALKKLIMADRMGGKADPCSTTTSSAEDSSGSSSSNTSAESELGARRCHQACHQACRASSAPLSRASPHQQRRHRSHRRQVWKMHGKYHQETTVQMVRWIQEQMGSRGDGAAERHGQGQGDRGAAPARKQSLAEAELGVQRLVDDLSNAALKEKMLLSIAQMVDRNDRQTEKTRAFLKLASDFYEHYQFMEKKQERERMHLLSEEARLRKELALKNAIFQAYTGCHSNPPEVPEVIKHIESFTDSCPIPTLVK